MATEVGEKMAAMPIAMTIEQPTGCLMNLRPLRLQQDQRLLQILKIKASLKYTQLSN